KIFLDLRKLPFQEKLKNNILHNLVDNLYQEWSTSPKKIYRLSTLGWNRTEVIEMVANILEHYDTIKTDYKKTLKKFGPPPELSDDNLSLYEKAIKMNKSS